MRLDKVLLKVHSGEDELLVLLFMPGSGIGEEETLLFLYVTSEVEAAFRTEFLMEEKDHVYVHVCQTSLLDTATNNICHLKKYWQLCLMNSWNPDKSVIWKKKILSKFK